MNSFLRGAHLSHALVSSKDQQQKICLIIQKKMHDMRIEIMHANYKMWWLFSFYDNRFKKENLLIWLELQFASVGELSSVQQYLNRKASKANSLSQVRRKKSISYIFYYRRNFCIICQQRVEMPETVED
jgi:hypothetical protein